MESIWEDSYMCIENVKQMNLGYSGLMLYDDSGACKATYTIGHLHYSIEEL